ncbi:hypothetical protein SAMN04489761_2684 [Tenacibaculum sp. MAR_2009_124]|uniref:hypothetical protein n=1 Tax=Tenacibaculum sp. MAR_2009_124 TaxID=1250059 RepID=UPI0008956606|nr:hypothetical protein [Tenacibaculum sp. MAR_2009_124]SEC32639.1 hypothetical protein SAMN04489761_2684 [Tenacibaculum sp. MAR_2009_124]
MLKNLKSLFIVDDSTDEKKEPTEKKKEQPKKEVVANKQNITNQQPTTNAGKVDNGIIDKLLGAIEKNNLDGFDYLEFKKALKALEKIPMDESTKYRSTFATASTMGVTLENLIESTTHYIKVLDKENNTFTKAFEGQLTSKVGNKEKEIVQFDAIIKEKSEKIKQLTEEITKHQVQITELRKVVDESKTKIDKTRNDFKLSYLHLRTQLEQDVEKMKQYLK